MLNGKTILITGGTGSFGKQFTKLLLDKFNVKKIIIYSRDEHKQVMLQQQLEKHKLKIRYFIGDIRDKERLYRAFEGVDYVIHAAALKHVPVCEYNPFEAIKTNIHGAQNIVDAAIDKGVKQVIALSTDKAVNPISLYGATKLASDKLFIAANSYVGSNNTSFSVVRFGNIAGSRGSVIPLFKKLITGGAKELPITDFRMTRFWITVNEAAELVLKAIKTSKGGEIYVSKIPSFKITDLAEAISPQSKLKEIGIREGEKLHESWITEYDSFYTFEFDSYFIVYPNHNWWNSEKHFTEGGKKVDAFFSYSSDKNNAWLSKEDLIKKLSVLKVDE